MSWKAYINDTEVIPYNLNSTKITEYYEDYFRIRTKFSGPVVLIDDPSTGQNDFSFVKALSFDQKHTFELKRYGQSRYSGVFSRYDCEVNETEKKITFTPSLSDALTIIQEKEDIEVNVLTYSNRESIRLYLSSYLVFMTIIVLDENAVDPPSSYGLYYTYEGVKLVTGEDVDIYVYATEIAKIHTDNPIPSGWSNYDLQGNYRLIQRAFSSSVFTPPTDEQIFFPFSPKEALPTAPFEWWPTLIQYQEGGYETPTGPTINSKEIGLSKAAYYGHKATTIYYNYKAYELKATLQRLISNAAPDFTGDIKSTLLFFDQAETGGPNFYTGFYGYEYPNFGTINRKVYQKYLIEKSDFKRPSAYQSATSSLMSWKKAMDFITNRFNAKWFIDNDGNIRIEHVMYKSLASEVDYRDQVTVRNEYKYDNTQIPNRITFQDNEAWSEDFTQKQIIYGHIPAIEGEKENREEIQTSFITTDVDGSNRYLDSLSDDGFVMVEEDSTFTGRVYRDTGAYSGLNYLQNVGLSWANCLKRYYRYEAYKNTFTMNENETTALSLKKLKIQDAVEFVDVGKPNLRNYAATIAGQGEIESMEYPCSDEERYTVKLKYPV